MAVVVLADQVVEVVVPEAEWAEAREVAAVAAAAAAASARA